MNKMEGPKRQDLDEKAKNPMENRAKQPDGSNILAMIALLFTIFIILLIISRVKASNMWTMV